MSKVPVTNRKVPVTLLILIVRDICYIARDNYGKYGRDKLVLTRDTFRKSARDRAKMPVTNSKKSVSRPLLGVTGNKTNTAPDPIFLRNFKNLVADHNGICHSVRIYAHF